jgi:hypothetical protein
VVSFTPRPLYPRGKNPSLGTHWRGGWVDPRADLDDVEKRTFLTLPGLELRPLRRPARSQTLSQLIGVFLQCYINYRSCVASIRKSLIIYSALNRIWYISRYFPHIYVEGLRQTKKPVSLCKENQCPVFEIGMPAYRTKVRTRESRRNIFAAFTHSLMELSPS